MKKKIFALIAMVMVISTVMMLVSFISATDTPDAKIMNSTLTSVTVDGILSESPPEYIMATELGNVTLGSSWNQSAESLYIAAAGEGLTSAKLEIGGKTFDADIANATTGTGDVPGETVTNTVDGMDSGRIAGGNGAASINDTGAEVTFKDTAALSGDERSYAQGGVSVLGTYGAREMSYTINVADMGAYDFSANPYIADNVDHGSGEVWFEDVNMDYDRLIFSPSANVSEVGTKYAGCLVVELVRDTTNGLVLYHVDKDGVITEVVLGDVLGQDVNIKYVWNKDNTGEIWVDGDKKADVANMCTVYADSPKGCYLASAGAVKGYTGFNFIRGTTTATPCFDAKVTNYKTDVSSFVPSETPDVDEPDTDTFNVVANANKNVAEIAVPIEGMTLKHNGKNVYVEAKITVTTTEDAVFEGNIVFLPYSPALINNKILQTHNTQLVDATKKGDEVFSVVDDVAEIEVGKSIQRGVIFFADAAVTTTKNMFISFDMNMKSMPATLAQKDGPEELSKLAEARVWMAFRYTTSDQLYINLINNADHGVQLVVMNAGMDQMTSDFTVVNLGKQLGEKFNLSLAWNEAGTLDVYVDGKFVSTVTKTSITSPNLGQRTGIVFMETARGNAFNIDEKIDVEFSNISISHLVDAYDEAALIALSGVAVEIPTETITESETTTKPETSKPATNKPEDTTESDVGGDSDEEPVTPSVTTDSDTAAPEDDGCKSSIAAYGAVMVIGSALMAVVATSKKKED